MRKELFRKHLGSQEFEQKLNLRLERLQRAELNPIDRLNFLVDVQSDPLTFINLCGVVYEPRLPENPDIPFFPFPYQVDTLYRIKESEETGHDLYIEKTRDMGITWLVLWYFLWKWLFTDNWYGLVGSRKEVEVDSGTPQSLFGKLRYGLYSIPTWLKPKNYRKSDCDMHLKLVNPERSSFIEGESANQNFARGKRASIVMADELLFWKFARESWRSMTDATQCRIAISTATPSHFGRTLRDSFSEQGRLVTLDWKMHPFKDEQWFKEEEERRKADPLSVEGELEISYHADPERAYYPEVENCKTAEVDYDPTLPLFVGCDFGAQDKTAFVYVQRTATSFVVLDAFEKHRKPLHWFYPFLLQGYTFLDEEEYVLSNKFTQEKLTLKRSDYLPDELAFIRRFNTWKKPLMYCGEAAHRQRMLKSNTSVAQELAARGVFLRINTLGITHSVRRAATKRLLNRCLFSTKYEALILYDALANSLFVAGRDNSASSDRMDKPIHDESADLRSALENLAVNVSDQLTTKVRESVYQDI